MLALAFAAPLGEHSAAHPCPLALHPSMHVASSAQPSVVAQVCASEGHLGSAQARHGAAARIPGPTLAGDPPLPLAADSGVMGASWQAPSQAFATTQAAAILTLSRSMVITLDLANSPSS